MPGLFDSLLNAAQGFGGFVERNPTILPLALQAYATDQALRSPSYDPSYHGKIRQQGLQGAGQMLLQGNRMEQQRQQQAMQNRLLEERLAASRAERAKQQRMQQAYQGLLAPREQTDVDIDATQAEIQPQMPLNLSPEQAALYRAMPADVGLPAMLKQMEPGDPYTLSPGQVRYGPGNEPIAAVPPKPPAPTSLGKLLQEYNALPPNDPRRRAYQQRIIKETTRSGETVQVSPDGTITLTRGGTSSLPGGRADELRGESDALGLAMSKLDKTIQSIESDRSRAGVAGTLRAVGQRGLGIVEDLSEFMPGFVSDMAKDARQEMGEDAGGYFDPDLPQNEVFENSLAYALARARKGSGRLNRQDVENARDDVRIRGLKSTDEVLAKLKSVRNEIREARSVVNRRLAPEPGKMSDDELLRSLGLQ